MLSKRLPNLNMIGLSEQTYVSTPVFMVGVSLVSRFLALCPPITASSSFQFPSFCLFPSVLVFLF